VEEQIIEFKKVAAKIAEASPTSMDGELKLRRSLDDGDDRHPPFEASSDGRPLYVGLQSFGRFRPGSGRE
jgi:hypothetical protein